MYTYKIRAFNEATAQIVVEFEDLGPMAIDLVVDENGNVPEGQDLDSAIRQFLPVWHIERRQKLTAGISNADSVRALVEPFPPPPPPTAEELANAARSERDRLLSASDWTQLADISLTEEQKHAWSVYRQALRDIPQQAGFPSEISWPDTP